MPDDLNPTPNFADLEKQLAKDTLEKALKALHGEINLEIARNKQAFSQEIKQTLHRFKSDLEKTVSSQIDQRLETLLKKHFSTIGQTLSSLVSTSFSPVLKKTGEEMDLLAAQGEKTVRSWEAMMERFSSIWNKPFFSMLIISVFVGTLTSLVSSYYFVRADRTSLRFAEETLHWFVQHVKSIEAKDKGSDKQTPKISGRGPHSKKKTSIRKK